MRKIKILIADDHAVLRMGLRSLFSSESDLKVVAEAANGEDAVRLARELQPDVVVMDLMMPKLSGAEATARIRQASPAVHVMVLTSYGTSQELFAAIDNGAEGVFLKDALGDELIEAVRRVARGETVLAEAVRNLIDGAEADSPLTKRQEAILQAVSEGLSDKEIAQKFAISLSGAKHHLRAIFAKLGASNRAEAVALGRRL